MSLWFLSGSVWGMRLFLPDSDPIDVPENTTVFELAKKLKKGALVAGAFINKSREISDLRTPLKNGDHVRFLLLPSEGSLEVIRHSSAHVMAQAVQELWPNVKVTIGPVIEGGFYYDFDSPKPFCPEDLETIENKMKEIINRKLEVTKEVWPKEKAISVFKEMKEHYKVEIIQEINEPEVSVYRQGEWLDLCKGPHVNNLSQIGAVKVLRQSGAYWRGDEEKAQLQRVYGTAFHTEKELKQYLKNLEESAKRDHRKLGKEMGLFYFSDLSPGSPFFTGTGAFVYNELKRFLREMYVQYGYEEVITPQIFSSALFKQSGHAQHFVENMYPVLQKSAQPAQTEQNLSFLKPMNCPGHCVLYSFQKRSYRDLPWRVADFGRLHRREKKGVLHGLTRVNSMCQDDAHLFCAPDQLQEEIESILKMFQEVYGKLGLKEYKIALSTRPDNSMGEDGLWNKAEDVLSYTLEKLKIPFEIHAGEGAFYGPKLDMLFVDAMKRVWQLGTLQCDFNMPKAFNLKYVDSDNKEKMPILLHRAILGSLERFIGVYLEHTGGHFPLWLSPVQVLFINISKNQEKYVKEYADKMKERGIRVETDLRAEKLGYKIRAGRLRRIPCMAIVGERETKSQSVSVRLLDGKNISLKMDIFVEKLLKIIQKKDCDIVM